MLLDPHSVAPLFGELGQTGFLYHLILGKILKGVTLDTDAKFYIIRFFNILLGSINVLVFLKLIRLVFKNTTFHLIGLLIFTNVLMFNFLTSAISYDNLINLFGTLLVYYTVALFKKKEIKYFFYVLIFFCLGLLTKRSMLLFLPIIGVAAIFVFIKIKEVNLLIFQRNHKWLLLTTTFTLLMLSSFFVRNYQEFGKPYLLQCSDIYDNKTCNKNSIHQTFRELKFKHKNQPRVSIIRYFDTWDDSMVGSTFGILCQHWMAISWYERFVLKLIFLLFLLFLVRYIHHYDKIGLLLLFIGFSYSASVFYYNYLNYLNVGELDGYIHGRYLFPVFSALILVLLYPFYVGKIHKWINISLGIGICSFVLFLGFPSYLLDDNRHQFEELVNHQEESDKKVYPLDSLLNN